MQRIDVAVFDEQEIFRRGVVACLGTDPQLRVVADGAAPPPTVPNAPVQVAVVSMAVAGSHRFDCSLVVCGGWDEVELTFDSISAVSAVLARNRVSADQLVSAVRAAAAGLHVRPWSRAAGVLDQRSVEVLQLLAGGAATREISQRMGYSERTIKGIIHEIHAGLGARTRAQAVATALREHLI